MVLALAVAPVWATGDPTTDQEKAILALVLRQACPDGAYNIVDPKSRIPKENEGDKESIRRWFQADEMDISQMVDQLFERNKKPVSLSIKSSPKEGYVIGFNPLHAEDRVHGRTEVSVPVFNEKSGLVLVYIGTRTQPLVGIGWIILYKYKEGKIKELNKMPLWIA